MELKLTIVGIRVAARGMLNPRQEMMMMRLGVSWAKRERCVNKMIRIADILSRDNQNISQVIPVTAEEETDRDSWVQLESSGNWEFV